MLQLQCIAHCAAIKGSVDRMLHTVMLVQVLKAACTSVPIIIATSGTTTTDSYGAASMQEPHISLTCQEAPSSMASLGSNASWDLSHYSFLAASWDTATSLLLTEPGDGFALLACCLTPASPCHTLLHRPGAEPGQPAHTPAAITSHPHFGSTMTTAWGHQPTSSILYWPPMAFASAHGVLSTVDAVRAVPASLRLHMVAYATACPSHGCTTSSTALLLQSELSHDYSTVSRADALTTDRPVTALVLSLHMVSASSVMEKLALMSAARMHRSSQASSHSRTALSTGLVPAGGFDHSATWGPADCVNAARAGLPALQQAVSYVPAAAIESSKKVSFISLQPNSRLAYVAAAVCVAEAILSILRPHVQHTT